MPISCYDIDQGDEDSITAPAKGERGLVGEPERESNLASGGIEQLRPKDWVSTLARLLCDRR